MDKSSVVAQPLLTRGMKAVLISQFCSAFADNALFFAILAQLKVQLYPDWSQPILQIMFVVAYILLAPFVGKIADGFPKGRVMLFANSFKLLGALSICLGYDPFFGYALVGIGAASYSPAKYGILVELTDGDRLVKANSLMEASTIMAILIGSVAGGFLSDWNLTVALFACASIYGIAAIANFFIPRLSAVHQDRDWNLKRMLTDFISACCILWYNKGARFSLVGTSLFWGAGVTLRFLLVLWVPVVLGITDNSTPTVLNVMVAIGVIIGAGVAARLITLKTVYRCMPAGILIGVMVAIFAVQQNIWASHIILIILGILGGVFVVPLNALLQERGRQTVGAGNAIAVQNLGENTAMLLMLGLYSLAVKIGVPVVTAGIGFGALFALTITSLWIWNRFQKN